MEIEYTKEELVNIIKNVCAAEYSDSLPIHNWARAAKVLEAVAASRKELLRRIDRKHGSHYWNCLLCGNSKSMGHTDGCELAEELGDE